MISLITLMRILIAVLLSCLTYDTVIVLIDHEFQRQRANVALVPIRTQLETSENKVVNETVSYDQVTLATSIIGLAVLSMIIVITLIINLREVRKLKRKSEKHSNIKKELPRDPNEIDITFSNEAGPTNVEIQESTAVNEKEILDDPNVSSIESCNVRKDNTEDCEEIVDNEIVIEEPEAENLQEISYDISLESVVAPEISETVTLVSRDIDTYNQSEESNLHEQYICAVTKKDVEYFEKRLTAIEYSMKQSEIQAHEWNIRLGLAESELVDIHGQIYTIISKLDEGNRNPPNYIIVSKAPEHDNSTGTMLVLKKSPTRSFIKMIENSDSVPELTDIIVKDEFYNDRGEMLKNEVNVKGVREGSVEKELEESLVKLERLVKGRYVDPVTQLRARDIRPDSFRRVIPKVPTHILQPYRRSTFTETNIKSIINVKKPSVTPRKFRFS